MRLLSLLLLCPLPLFAQQKPVPSGPPGDEIVAHWHHLESKPAPASAEGLTAPPGFAVSVFADKLENARMLLTLEDGTLLLSRPKLSDVISLRDGDGDRRADTFATVASGIHNAHGLAMHGDTLFVAGENEIYTVARTGDDAWGTPTVIIGNLPTGAQHPYRTIGYGPDGKLYVSVGSTCNDCSESNPENATVLQISPDGSERRIFARGLRNTIGFDWHPETSELWGFDHGVDWRGDDVPPDELNRIVEGAHYGWPHCYGAQTVDETRPDPEGATKQTVCAKSKPSKLDLPAHSAPIGFTFVRGDGLPAAYRNDAFVALRGSWNRAAPQHPKIIRVHYSEGNPASIEDFVTGFMTRDGKSARARLAGVAVDARGALYFTDDENGVVYRVARDGQAPQDRTAEAQPTAQAQTAKPAAQPETAKPGAEAQIEAAKVAQPSSAEGAPATPGIERRSILAKAFKVEGLKQPESALHDEQQDVYFVSNCDGQLQQKDGRGFIAKVSPQGQVLAMHFIDGLDAPKGMAIRGAQLWVSDIDRMRAFDRATGAVLAVVDLKPQGAVFLNDVAAGADGALYVTDMAVKTDDNGRKRTMTDRIFRIDGNNQVSVALQGKELGAPNGIVWDGQQFVIAQNAGSALLGWKPGSPPRKIAVGPGEFDGIVAISGGRYLVSSHRDNAIHEVRDGRERTLFARPPTPADIGYDRKRNVLLVPSLDGGWLEAWQLPPDTARVAGK